MALLAYHKARIIDGKLIAQTIHFKITSEVSLEKVVDDFHPLNIGKRVMKGRDPLFLPCTSMGCIELLKRTGITIKGKRAVVVGRSNIVGLPVSLLLLKEDATVNEVHSHTPDPQSIICDADIVIAAARQSMMARLRELPRGVLDSLTPEQLMPCNTEDECT